MELTSIGEVIATRELFVLGDPERKALVSIGKPKAFDDGTGFFCPFQITGVGHEQIRYAGGVDEVQAIELGMQSVAIEIFVLQHDFGVELRWGCAPEDENCGFPSVRPPLQQ